MTRTLLITAAIVFAVPLAAGAQNIGSSGGTKCGPVAWSSEKMNYTSAPCAGETASVAGPTANQAASTGSQSQSSSMTKAEMKQGYQPMPMQQQAQAVPRGPNSMAPGAMGSSASMGSNMAAMGDQCGASNAATMKDEYGRNYNCRGDRIR